MRKSPTPKTPLTSKTFKFLHSRYLHNIFDKNVLNIFSLLVYYMKSHVRIAFLDMLLIAIVLSRYK